MACAQGEGEELQVEVPVFEDAPAGSTITRVRLALDGQTFSETSAEYKYDAPKASKKKA